MTGTPVPRRARHSQQLTGPHDRPALRVQDRDRLDQEVPYLASHSWYWATLINDTGTSA